MGADRTAAVKRGEIWTASGAPGYGSKPRPALIVQSDVLTETDSILTCGFTAQPDNERYFRPQIVASSDNGLGRTSHVMTEKLTAIPRAKLGKRIGKLTDEDMEAVERALHLVLGFAG